MAGDTEEVERFDVVVVGSGAAGGAAALELSRHGLSVLVLEAGRAVGPADLLGPTGRATSGPDILGRLRAMVAGQPIQARVAFFNKRMVTFLVKDRMHRYRGAAGAPYLWFRGRQVGGRLHIFGRVLHRWSDRDFEAHFGSGGTAWPIRYADLAPYYARIERLLQIQGNRDGVPTMPDGEMAGPAPLTRSEARFQGAVERRWRDRRVTAWRFALPDTTPMPAPLAAALASGNVTLRADAVVTRILTEPSTGRATGLRFRDRASGAEREVAAGAVVLGASPVETVRLLLASRSERHPEGIGNSSGLLGRYFMDQPAAIVFARFPANANEAAGDRDGLPVDPRYGTTGGVYVARSTREEGGGDAELGSSFQGSIGRQAHVRPSARRDATFMSFSEMRPDAENRITLDPRGRDRWGVPLPRITCRLGRAEKAAVGQQVEEAVAMIAEAGGEAVGWISPLGLQERGEGLYRDLNPVARWLVRKMLPGSLRMGAAIHESGGARMGTDPRQSVVDAYNRCWDAPNILVTDASAFVSSGTMGTTLTVMALATRACARLAETMREERQ